MVDATAACSVFAHVDLERILRSVCIRLHIRSGDEKDEFVQDLWVYLLHHDARITAAFSGRSSFATYISRVITNYGSNWKRRSSRRERRLVPLNEASLLVSAASLDGGFDSTRWTQVAQACACLRPSERKLVQLWLDGQKVGQIAHSLGTSRNAVYCRTARVVKKLRYLAKSPAASLDRAQRRTGVGVVLPSSGRISNITSPSPRNTWVTPGNRGIADLASSTIR